MSGKTSHKKSLGPSAKSDKIKDAKGPAARTSHPTDETIKESKEELSQEARRARLRQILLAKRDALMQTMQTQLGQSLTAEQQRRLESAMDSGDQALVDLEQEMGISLQEMRNKERLLIEEALASLEEGTYGRCAECDAEISEKRLEALPFAKYCIECQTRLELLEKIEKSEQRA
ncbi:MAG: transcriptional regulator, TraR/DksA family protein [Nitrospirae bacterium]|nr:MAG: transcriptional regulator, TraR/DksA family protein [Nitrospirota bacterium]